MSESYRLYSSLPGTVTPKVTALIDAAALRHNYRTLADPVLKKNPSARCMGVVKADAYGHSAKICVPALLDEGCDYFAVSSLDEAASVRAIAAERGAHPDILILGYTPACDAPVLERLDVTQTCFSMNYARKLAAAAGNGRVKVHIKFDTGMNRIGFPAHNDAEIEQSAADVIEVTKMPSLSVDGVLSHFARADDTTPGGVAATRLQAERFVKVCSAVEAAGFKIPYRHMSASTSAILYPEYDFDGCRFGISLYGPDYSGRSDVDLRPVMSVRTVAFYVHKLLKGESVSYGGIFTADRDMTIATMPIGYADGFVRAFTGCEVRVIRRDGTSVPAKVIGRICMDTSMIDVTGLGVSEGDTVVISGYPGQIEKLSEHAGTIPNEALCWVSARVMRIPV